ncbi:MAG: hypothetical protein KIT35_21870 [Piscinibacter sp.]|uniref:OB-fold protein n=1 Tax=Piscinibacter sp. TaxID=1903157 RepID=UPI002582C48A|nr:hypothetical protein [Piscinibacter sp.]MCW5666488.1 hypothetical protein [Piscinibacter sp.]
MKVYGENIRLLLKVGIPVGLVAAALVWLGHEPAKEAPPAAPPAVAEPAVVVAPVSEKPEAIELPIFKTTPQALVALYEENEVAADDAMKGHAIEIAGRVLAIDKDVADDVVLRFALQRETYGLNPSATLKDTPEIRARAAKLRRGDTVTLWCAGVRRIATMPILSRCLFKPEDPSAVPVRRSGQ